MELVYTIFGQGKDLTVAQMCSRAIVVFALALVLVRISGRRSFGLHSPLDNITTILLGAILSRSVVGASAFLPVIASCLVIVCLHRLLGIAIARNKAFGLFLLGHPILLYEAGSYNEQNMKRALVNRDDVISGIRKAIATEDLTLVDKIFMERNGEISVVKKKEND